MSTSDFILDKRLDADTFFVRNFGLCRVLLLNDSRWPWLVLVPQRAGIIELFDLSPKDRALLIEEVEQAAKLLVDNFQAEKVNFGSLGNIVSQFHMHVIGRSARDPAWPGSPFGHPGREPYDPETAETTLARLRGAPSR